MAVDDVDPDLVELVGIWAGAATTDDRRAALLHRLEHDAPFRALFVAEARMLGMLQVVRSSAPRWLRLEDELGWSADDAPTDFVESVTTRIESLPEPPRTRRSRWRILGTATATLLLALIGLWLFRSHDPKLPAERIGLIVQLDGSIWEGVGPTEGDILGPGVLALQSGSATLALFNGVTINFVGPAKIDLHSLERLDCQMGKFRIDAPAEAVGFTTTTADTVISPAADFALTVSENGATSIAVYDGRADLMILNSRGHSVQKEFLSSGQAMRIAAGRFQVTNDGLMDGEFAGPIPTITPSLTFAPNYSQVILAARPSNYWRFEKDIKGTTPNEISGQPSLRLIGEAAPGELIEGNRSLSLPPPTEEDQHGAISEAPWRPQGADYTLECWAMCRLVRQASIFGLVTEVPSTHQDRHGVLLEFTGQPSPYRHPERSIRVLHRLPVGSTRGVNLFSSSRYLPYTWYHLVLCQSGTRLELYANGELVGLGSPSTSRRLPSSRIILGALHAARDGSSATNRPFVGLIDEVATYDRALNAEEIQQHWKLGSGQIKGP